MGARRELELLTALEQDGNASQLALSKRVGIAVGLVNAVLRRAIRKGYVKVRAAPAKRYVYYVTPRGFSEKARLVSEYLNESLEFFRRAQLEYADIFRRVQLVPNARIVVVGGGDLVEIALLAAEHAKVQLLGVVAPFDDVQVSLGLPLVRDIADFGDVDFVIVACARDPQTTYDDQVAAVGHGKVLAPPMLRIAGHPKEQQR